MTNDTPPLPDLGSAVLRSRARTVGVLAWRAWCFALRALLFAALVIASLSPRLIDRDWRFDLVASLLAQFVLGALVLAVWQLIFRRWIWCSLFSLVAAGSFSWVLMAERAPYDRSALARGADPVLRILSMNVHTLNPEGAALRALIEAHKPDIVVIVEMNQALMKAITADDAILSSYPHRQGLDEGSLGKIAVLSALPLDRQAHSESADGLLNSWGYRAGFIEVEGARLRFAAVHAPSPRSEATWRIGTGTFDRLARSYERMGAPLDDGAFRTVMVGDLNCSPTSMRSRHVTRIFGLARAKPLHIWDGTFPSRVPWFARSSIDGALISPDIVVGGWRTVGLPGSDHRGVLLEFSIPIGEPD